MTTKTTEAVAACAICGVATSQRLVPRQVRGFDGGLHDADGFVSGLCDDCAAMRPEEPGVALRAAARVLGVAEGDPHLEAALCEEDEALDRLLYGQGREPQRRPFAHVSKETRARLKAARVRALDHKVHAAADHDRPVPPHAPDPGFPPGCLACGVGKSAEWHGPLTTTALTRGRDMVTGVVCGACVEHLTAAGAVGAQFLERAVMAHFGKAWGQNVRLPRLRAWYALHRAEGYPPQARPWAWVTELRDPEPDLDPVLALQIAVRELTERVAELEAGLGK